MADLNRRASGRSALILLGLWLTSAIALQISDQRLALLANGETKLDLRLGGYELQSVQTLFEAYGAGGRDLYMWNLAIDTLMPFFLALATVQFILLALRRSNLATLLVMVPVVFLLADMIENLLLVTLVNNFPAINPDHVSLASAITRPKLLAAIMTYVLLIVSALIVTSRTMRDRLTKRHVSSQTTD